MIFAILGSLACSCILDGSDTKNIQKKYKRANKQTKKKTQKLYQEKANKTNKKIISKTKSCNMQQ